jgi:DNA-binding HxlR family transcriptional regulator
MSLNLNSSNFTTSYQPQPALDRITEMDVFDTDCAAHQMLEHITNKWTVLIIYALVQGKKRYSELKHQIVGVSPKVLIQNLRNLERCGLIEREVFSTIPPRVDYSLTQLGKSLVGPLAILGEWSYRHISDVKAAIENYDQDPTCKDYWEPK